MTTRRRVVIVGGGFGGLTAARVLGRSGREITIVDRQNHHLFQPLLYQVAMAGLAPSEIAVPIRGILRSYPNVQVLLAEVEGVDFEAREVQLKQGEPLPYDFLILAPGARTHYFGNDQWELFAPGLKNLDDAVEIRRRVLLAFEAAERESDAARRAELLSFVVIGGGPTGVELAGAVAELARHVLARDFRRASPSEVRVVLVEGGARVLSSFDASLSAATVRQLSELGVEVRTETMVADIRRSSVVLRTGESIAAATVMWAAGVAASPLIAKLGIDADRAGRARVRQDCSLLVLFDWAWSYFTYRRGARLITGGRMEPGAPPSERALSSDGAAEARRRD